MRLISTSKKALRLIMMKTTTMDDKVAEYRGYVELLTSELDTTLHLLDKFEGEEYDMGIFCMISSIEERDVDYIRTLN